MPSPASSPTLLPARPPARALALLIGWAITGLAACLEEPAEDLPPAVGGEISGELAGGEAPFAVAGALWAPGLYDEDPVTWVMLTAIADACGRIPGYADRVADAYEYGTFDGLAEDLAALGFEHDTRIFLFAFAGAGASGLAGDWAMGPAEPWDGMAWYCSLSATPDPGGDALGCDHWSESGELTLAGPEAGWIDGAGTLVLAVDDSDTTYLVDVDFEVPECPAFTEPWTRLNPG